MSWSEWESDAYGPITLFYIGGGIQLSTDGDKFYISMTAQWCGAQVPQIDSETAARLLNAWKRRQKITMRCYYCGNQPRGCPQCKLAPAAKAEPQVMCHTTWLARVQGYLDRTWKGPDRINLELVREPFGLPVLYSRTEFPFVADPTRRMRMQFWRLPDATTCMSLQAHPAMAAQRISNYWNRRLARAKQIEVCLPDVATTEPATTPNSDNGATENPCRFAKDPTCSLGLCVNCPGQREGTSR